jgi:hypothetical protein
LAIVHDLAGRADARDAALENAAALSQSEDGRVEVLRRRFAGDVP